MSHDFSSYGNPDMKYIRRILLIIGILLVFTVVNFFVVRSHYEYRIAIPNYNGEDISVSLSRDDIVRVTDTGVKKSGLTKDRAYYYVQMDALSSGKVSFTIHSANDYLNGIIVDIKVYPSGIICEEGYIGSVGNLMIVRYEIVFLFLFAAVNLSISIVKHMRINPYSYRIMYYVGALTFTVVNLLPWVISLFPTGFIWKDRLFSIYSSITGIASNLPILFFPMILILAILLSVSNVVLMIHEGFRLHNMLGIGLGLTLIVLTVIPFFIYPVAGSFADVSSNLAVHVVSFLESAFFSIVTYLECMMVGTVISTVWAQRRIPKFEQDYMIILGSGLRADGTVTPLLKSRADRAVWFAAKQKEKTGKDLIFVPSGGQGEDEVCAEAVAVKNYLLSCNVPEGQILTEEKSTSTYENMKFSKEIIGENAKGKEDIHIAFSTTDYHVFRSGRYAYKLGMNASGIGAGTKWYFYVNALIREFAANMKAQQKRHLVNVIYIVLLMAIVIALSFRFGIM